MSSFQVAFWLSLAQILNYDSVKTLDDRALRKKSCCKSAGRRVLIFAYLAYTFYADKFFMFLHISCILMHIKAKEIFLWGLCVFYHSIVCILCIFQFLHICIFVHLRKQTYNHVNCIFIHVLKWHIYAYLVGICVFMYMLYFHI